MKGRRFFTILIFLCSFLFSHKCEAQFTQWLVESGFHGVDFQSAKPFLNTFPKAQDWISDKPTFHLKLGHQSKYGLLVLGAVSLGRIKNYPDQLNRELLILELSTDLALSDLPWIGIRGAFQPYLDFGMHYSQFGNDAALGLHGGLGLNLIVSSGMALRAQSTYKNRFNKSDFLHHSIGFAFSIRKLPDRDGDGISDRLDECPTVRGPKTFGGCPDSDRDGIEDREDDCPYLIGLAQFKGCPDRDNDSIPDNLDKCPMLPGKAETGGCPDADGDGTGDPFDGCPETPGPKHFQGCPDSDGDGTRDDIDECPDTPGPIPLNGCPDDDGDGIPNSIDKCPSLKGEAENMGCPESLDPRKQKSP